MWKKLLKSKAGLTLLSGICIFTAFPPIEIIPLLFLGPFILNLVIRKCATVKQGLLYGYFLSIVLMIGSFYWVVYVAIK